MIMKFKEMLLLKYTKCSTIEELLFRFYGWDHGVSGKHSDNTKVPQTIRLDWHKLQSLSVCLCSKGCRYTQSNGL
jgi:hypothetical protein